MARVETIVVGGGVNAQSPFTAGRIPYISNTDPPFLAASPVMTQVTGASPAIVISPTAADPQASATTILRVVGGIASFADTTANGLKRCILGARQTLTNLAGVNNQTIIGNDINVDTLGTNSTIVGHGITRTATGGGGSTAVTAVGSLIAIGGGQTTVIAIGANITVGDGNGGASGSNIYIGDSITVGGGAVSPQRNTLIGTSITAGASSGINSVVGSLCVMGTAIQMACVGYNNNFSNGLALGGVLGLNNVIAHSSCIILGHGVTTTAANQCYIGGLTGGAGFINTVIIGRGDTGAAPNAVTIRLTDGSGVDVAGAALTVQSGAGTGAGAASSIIFRTPTVGAAGAAAQAQAIRLTIGSTVITSLVPIILPVGAVGAPSLRFSDADTGLFEQAAGNVAVAVNGVESARFSGGAAGETNFMLYDVTAATLQRVSIGAADSGGVGFRVLRIPN